MRKFITFGISTVAAGSIFLTASGPAAIAQTTTTTTVANTIVDDVCLAVPDVTTAVTDAMAGYDIDADVANYEAKKAAALEASTTFVSALVTYLQDVADESADLPISSSALTVRQGQYGDALAAWSEAAVAAANHFGELEYLGLQNAALTQLSEGLDCTPPVVED